MAKRLPERSVVCTNCRAPFVAAPRYTFLGLLRFHCPACSQSFVYPMTDRRRKWYWVIAIAFGALTAALLMFAGRIALPGILPVGAVIGLVQDSAARRKVAEVEARMPVWSAMPARPDR